MEYGQLKRALEGVLFAAGEPVTQQPGRENTGVIEDQTVAGPQIVRQIVEVAMFPCTGILVQHQQAGGIPSGNGGLGDKLLGVQN